MGSISTRNMQLNVDFCGVKFRNPLVLASGVLGVTGASLKHVVASGAGGVTTKSIWREGHMGHPNPVIIANDHFMLNAVGLPDAGIEKAHIEIGEYLKNKPAPLIANIVEGRIDDFAEVAEKVTALKPDILEVNISCPNVEDEFGKPFACSTHDAAAVTRAVRKKTHLPIVIKLSPNVLNIAEIARSVVDAGADGICAINTVGPGLLIDLETREPILANKVGGVSGPAIKPLSLKAVYDIHKALPKIPIIGTGGITSGEDALEMIMVGATLVGVGTAVYYRGIECFGKIADEMQKWGKAHKIKHLDEIRGKAHAGEYSRKFQNYS